MMLCRGKKSPQAGLCVQRRFNRIFVDTILLCLGGKLILSVCSSISDTNTEYRVNCCTVTISSG